MAQGIGLQFAPVDLLIANDAIPKYSPGKTFYIDPRSGKKYLYVNVGLSTDNTSHNYTLPGTPVYWNVRANGTVRTGIGDCTEKSFAGVIVGNPDPATAGLFLKTDGSVYGAVAIATIAALATAPGITDGQYGWIQVEGDGYAFCTSALTINSSLIPDATNGGLKIEGAAATDVVVGTNKIAGGNRAASPPVATLINLRGYV